MWVVSCGMKPTVLCRLSASMVSDLEQYTANFNFRLHFRLNTADCVIDGVVSQARLLALIHSVFSSVRINTWWERSVWLVRLDVECMHNKPLLMLQLLERVLWQNLANLTPLLYTRSEKASQGTFPSSRGNWSNWLVLLAATGWGEESERRKASFQVCRYMQRHERCINTTAMQGALEKK